MDRAQARGQRVSQPVLVTRNLCKEFGALAVTQNVNFSLAAAARHALIGPNGAGKTSFINLLTGVLQPSAGQIWLAGENITRLRPDQRVKRGLARTFQINTLFPHLTLLEAVTMAVCERLGVTGRWFSHLTAQGDAVEEAHALLVQLKLADVCNQVTRELPYGRQRLLEIALALACRPQVLLLDEPAAGIPAAESEELFEVIAALPRGISILFIEHDMRLVMRFAERITVMVAGEILVEGAPSKIADDARVRAVYLGAKRRA
ncbi:MAG TPA: ABC transporter ATP-binding protein [Acidiferrobacterales bacterium]|nr:ABC transporter ATP-binding protein [Acidiferrobacterales bacterium]